MIITVTPNACVDKAYRIEDFSLGRVHRPSDQRTYAGGKGINVARAYQVMGGTALVTGFLGGQNGDVIRSSLDSEGIEHACVRTAGESRLCIAIIDPVTGVQTEVNETGPAVSPSEVINLRSTLEREAKSRNPFCVVLCGSLPPGASSSFYSETISAARAAGVRCALDSSGEPLKLGLNANPWIVKPNLAELEFLSGKSIRSEESTAVEARTIGGTGDTIVCVTLGERGCVGLRDGVVWRALPPGIEFVSGVGSGDAFLGAFLWSMEMGAEFPEALRLAVAAGAANAEVYGSGFITKQRTLELATGVRLKRAS